MSTHTQAPVGERRLLPEINALRCLAILSVIFHHYFYFYFKPSELNEWGCTFVGGSCWPLSVLFESGWLGVNLFFFLSGFVLYMPFVLGKKLSTRDDFKKFYVRRFWRLMPLYYFAGVIALALVYKQEPLSIKYFFNLFTFATATFNFHPSTFNPSYNGLLWSLGLEIWFSLLFPFLVLGYQSSYKKVFFVLILIVSVLVRLAGYVWTEPQGDILNWISDSLVGRLPDFLFGMAACEIYLTGRDRFYRSAGSLICGLALILSGMFLWHSWYAGDIHRYMASGMNLLLNTGFLLVTLFMLFNKKPFAWVGFRWVQVLGMMCYSLYIWHGMLAKKLAPEIIGPRLMLFPLFVVMLAVVAGFTYRYIEFPQKKWRELFLWGKSFSN